MPATGTTTSSAAISGISGFCVFGEARYGSNGDSLGAPEYDVGGSSSSQVAGRITWDGTPSDGVDSGWVTVQLTAEASGGANSVKWSVAGGSPSPLTYGGRTYGVIQRVRIRAVVQVPARMQWQQMVIQFFRNGRVTDEYRSTTGPEVDTSGSTPPVVAEQILEVTPELGTNTKVVVSALVRLSCPSGVVPDANDIFGQVFVDAANCTAV